MKVVNDTLPTEGVHIGGIHFKPGEAQTVEASLGKELTSRKGFKEVSIKAEKKED